MSTKRTPPPWNIATGQFGYSSVIEKGGRAIAHFTSSDFLQAEDDAAFALRAVNSHEALLEALRSVRNEYRSYVLNDSNLDDAKGSRILAQIDRAIAQADQIPDAGEKVRS